MHQVSLGRRYAIVLGALAFSGTIVRGVAHTASCLDILTQAVCALVVFAGLGLLAGWIAERTVEESIHARLVREMAPAAGATVRTEAAAA